MTEESAKLLYNEVVRLSADPKMQRKYRKKLPENARISIKYDNSRENIIKNAEIMLRWDVDIDTITDVTGLSKEELDKMKLEAKYH